MEAKTLNLYSLKYSQSKTYWIAALFILGNLLLPQLFHMFSAGGKIWLPIYFFTLIGSYKYGWKVGLLTAILSPLASSTIFGMPPVALLPIILVKSVLLAGAAGFAAHYFSKVTLPILIGVVMSYQIVGCAIEWAMTASFYDGIQDFRLAIPGMLLQVFGGYFAIKALSKI